MTHLHPLDRLRLERGAEHLHLLGPRAVAEALAEVATRIGGLPAILGTLNEYARYSPGKLRSIGGHKFPRRQLEEVPR